jgi:porin
VTYHLDSNWLDSNWYEKISVQRSESPQGLVAEYSHFNRHGLTFSEPNAKALVIDEVGFRQTASADTLFTYIRGGGLYNWTRYTDFNTGGTNTNWNVYLLGDQQLSRPDPGLPYGGWYGGFSVMESPSNVNVFRRYYEVRLYDKAPFKSRPSDQFAIVATHSLFSDDARRASILRGAYPPPKDASSLAVTYAMKLWHGI